jgi:hypothetical protein
LSSGDNGTNKLLEASTKVNGTKSTLYQGGQHPKLISGKKILPEKNTK